MRKTAKIAGKFQKSTAWFRIILLLMSWMILFSAVAYADDCLRDITRAED
ncbi:MAG: hypothetical protein N2491_03150 [Negativicutes bacterium]|nr:hypothetical protein [Negativicutes bacterium]